jgi:TPP-dependent indolepyruvate ferredoxin oxidoreductase alpha subunit
LQEHGPNIIFHRSINPQEVIDFIEANFDLSEKTGGYVSPRQTPRTSDIQDPLRPETSRG